VWVKEFHAPGAVRVWLPVFALTAIVTFFGTHIAATELFGDYPLCKTGGACPKLAPFWADAASIASNLLALALLVIITRPRS
jgi:hypothetical protein